MSRLVLISAVVLFSTPFPLSAKDDFSNQALMTSSNRKVTGKMMGGWGQHLRSLLTMRNGTQWFAAETGSNVSSNTSMVYYKKTDKGWKSVGSVALYPGIQQNMAITTDGRIIYAYGINTKSNWAMECWFDTWKPGFNLNTCNAIATNIPANSNYIGAAIRKDYTRITWWSVVGYPSGGQFYYTYNFGSGWNGPVASGILGYGSAGYVSASFDSKGYLRLVSELYLSGTYQAAIALLVPGQNVRWSILKGGRSSSDIWHDPISGTTHVLATQKVGVGYYVIKKADWPKSGSPILVFNNAYRIRFAEVGEKLILIHDDRTIDKILVRSVNKSELAEAVKWDTISPLLLPRPSGNGKAYLNAIWTQDRSKQLVQTNIDPAFAVCGSSPANDNKIWVYN